MRVSLHALLEIIHPGELVNSLPFAASAGELVRCV